MGVEIGAHCLLGLTVREPSFGGSTSVWETRAVRIVATWVGLRWSGSVIECAAPETGLAHRWLSSIPIIERQLK